MPHLSKPASALCGSFYLAVTRCAAAFNMPGPSETSLLDLVIEDVLTVVTSVVIFILACWTWDLFHREVFFVRRSVYLLMFASTSYFIHPPIAFAVLFALVLWVAILCSEVIVNEVRELKSRWFSVVGPAIGATHGTVAAVLRPSASDCDVRYHQVTICDTSVPEDSFWPHHISTIFVVEWRRRNMIWTTVRIWQVSLLNGGKKIVHQFHQVWPWTDGRPFEYGCTRAENVKCFQSHGVIFIMMHGFKDRADDYAMMFVYDTRIKKSAVYDLKMPNQPEPYAISITCISRLIGTDGSLEGWQVRILGADDDVDQLFGNRARIINEVYELRQQAFLVKSEEIVFGQGLSRSPVRTSRGHFGLMGNASDDTTPIVLFNEATTEYAVFRTFDDLLLMDDPLAAYIHSFPPLHWYKFFWPAFLNDREAMTASYSGIVSRITFRPSSLKYSAAKSFFQSNPQLRTRLNAEQFRQATGIGGMEGHFG